eukprot:g46234.t1
MYFIGGGSENVDLISSTDKRLSSLGLYSLEFRRMTGYLNEMYTINLMKGERNLMGLLSGCGRLRDNHAPEATLSAISPVKEKGGQGTGEEYVSGGGISLEVVERVSDDLLDVDAGGMVSKDKGNPISVVEGKRGVRVEVREMGRTRSRVLDRGTQKMVRSLYRSRVRGCIVQVAVEV